MQVYNVGSINIDHVYRVAHLVTPGETLSSQSLSTVLGGKGANQSVALARAGCRVSHIGRLSESDQWACNELAHAGVDVSCVKFLAQPSGHAIIQVDDEGENSIILHGGTNQSMSREFLESALERACDSDWLLLQNECNALEHAFEIATRKGMQIAFNPAPMTSRTRQLPLQQCALIIVNETEAKMLADNSDPVAALDALAKKYPDTRLVLTLGAKGAQVRYAGAENSVPAYAVEAVDTTGAGDTFVGYYLAALIRGDDNDVSLRHACAAAALSVTREGATPGIPSLDEVKEFLAVR